MRDEVTLTLSRAKAQQLEKIIEVFGPIAAELRGMRPGFYSLTDAAGNIRTLKLLAVDKENSAAAGQDGSGLPAGGTTGQVLTKQSATDADADWETPGLAWRNLTHSITVAGLVPTTTEINTALAATYTDPALDLVPADGDYVVLTVSSAPKFIACITTTALTASGVFVRSFVVNSVTYYATLSQCGLY